MKENITKRLALFMGSLAIVAMVHAQTRLLVRVDDMASSHAANVACIEAYQNGIATSVEVIVNGPWFEEAVTMLTENPGLDVGVHLALTSEWQKIKWKPLTYAPSLVDENGYFYPMIWANDNYPTQALAEREWKLDEIEQELRAQIELAMRRIPRLSHMSAHMGCTRMTDETNELLERLSEEYDLKVITDQIVYPTVRWTGKEFGGAEKTDRLIKMLAALEDGDYFIVCHPGLDVEELGAVGHIGYEEVRFDRAAETEALTNEEVKQKIADLNIELISYRDIK
ncbi:MAG: ChbG/HpnK family deacetylase [Cyclobacteriaceae bacterium]